MANQSSGGLGLPKYHKSKTQQRWVESKRRTAELIQSLWNAADKKQRSDPDFLCLLVQCGWTNQKLKPSSDSTRRWRNRIIADYLGVPYSSDDQLAQALSSRFPKLSLQKCRALLSVRTGIADYYKALRPGTLKYVKKHAAKLTPIFQFASSTPKDVSGKVRQIAVQIESLGEIPAAGRHVSPFNGLTPTLCCLDPQRRFPIMNERTRRLLRSISVNADVEGLFALTKLIGPTYGIKDAYELDAYAYGEKFTVPKPASKKLLSIGSYSDVGLKSELNSIAQIAAKKTVITKQHNKLINDLSDYLRWRYKPPPKQHRFDALVPGWKKNRNLLIEAKTSSEGASGRSQVRQAIGQLFDYRLTHMPNGEVDLAVLLPKEPKDDVKKLLASLHIELLWFKGKSLMGTIQL